MNREPEVCSTLDRLTGDTGRRLGGLGGDTSRPRMITAVISMSPRTALCCTSSHTGERIRTFFNGDDCRGDTTEENEFFLFRLGVRGKSSGKPWVKVWGLVVFEDLVKAGPRRLTAGELRALKACRFVFTPLALPLFSKDRGVKKRRKDRGVTVGGFRCRRPPAVSDATEGGEEGISWDGGGRIGSDRGGSGRPESPTIVCSIDPRLTDYRETAHGGWCEKKTQPKGAR